MNWYAHIDQTDDLDKYLVRVTSVTEIVDKDAKGREIVTGAINGKEIDRFEHKSQLRGTRLRQEVEAEAKRRMSQ